jgi:aspartate 1-decarboxylase
MPSRCFLSAKIHGAVITGGNVEYRGSLAVDPELLRAAGILPFERIDVYNLDNGERFTTYAIPGGPGEICLNGAAAHKGRPGQRVIVAAYVWLAAEEWAAFRPRTVLVDRENRAVEVLEGRIEGP